MSKSVMAALLSFNGGYVDTAGFIGLQGLFTAHVTGNFVTLGAALVFGTHGVVAKLLALPEFIAVVVVARLAGMALMARSVPALRPLLTAKVLLLLAFFVLAVAFGPFPDSDAPAALAAGFAGVAAMAVQNAVQRVQLPSLPPSTLMTGNTTQAALDVVDLVRGTDAARSVDIRARLVRTLQVIFSFAAGCAMAAILYFWVGFWCLAIPVVVSVATALLRTES